MDFIVNFEQLQRLCRPFCPRPTVTTVRRWANRQGIPYLTDGRGGIWTTAAALNRVLGIDNYSDQHGQPITADMM